MFSVILQILKEEGLPGLYKGFGATMLNTFSMRAFMILFWPQNRTYKNLHQNTHISFSTPSSGRHILNG